jgi:hypothetical protein
VKSSWRVVVGDNNANSLLRDFDLSHDHQLQDLTVRVEGLSEQYVEHQDRQHELLGKGLQFRKLNPGVVYVA